MSRCCSSVRRIGGAFLEEAAGVARFYARRDQAWRRLTETRRNLQRIRDLAAEIESRLDTLREQAQVAERGADLQRELREGQMTLARHRLFTVNRQLEAAEEREQQATETLAAILAEPVEELRRQAAQASLRSSELEQELATARRQVEQAPTRGGGAGGATRAAGGTAATPGKPPHRPERTWRGPGGARRGACRRSAGGRAVAGGNWTPTWRRCRRSDCGCSIRWRQSANGGAGCRRWPANWPAPGTGERRCGNASGTCRAKASRWRPSSRG